MTHKSKKKNIVFKSTGQGTKSKHFKARRDDPNTPNREDLARWRHYQSSTGTTHVDGAAALYNKGFRLELTHVPSDRTLYFGAFIEQFSDAYNSEWNAEHVFGRMDPIATFMHTRRAISVAWKIPSASVEEAVENINKINELMTYLYPMYDGSPGSCGATTINMGPLMRVKFGNLIQDGNGNKQGLLGYVNGFTMDPIIEDGMYMFDWYAARNDPDSQIVVKNYPDSDPLNCAGESYLPKTVRLNFELTALHEHPLGWTATAGRTGKEMAFAGGGRTGFPYAVARAPDHMPFTNAFKNSLTTKKSNPEHEEPKGEVTPSKAEVRSALKGGTDMFRNTMMLINQGAFTREAWESLARDPKDMTAKELIMIHQQSGLN
jgi:hypothetical protein